jgi:hypothetical protein
LLFISASCCLGKLAFYRLRLCWDSPWHHSLCLRPFRRGLEGRSTSREARILTSLPGFWNTPRETRRRSSTKDGALPSSQMAIVDPSASQRASRAFWEGAITQSLGYLRF